MACQPRMMRTVLTIMMVHNRCLGLVVVPGSTYSRRVVSKSAIGVSIQEESRQARSVEEGTESNTKDESDILLRAARGEDVERTPVWLMRQAGRYMASFREYSDKYPFRMRSETPEIATELSLQCWKAFGVDGVIFFSDILTPLPALGVEFDVVKGKGPLIEDTLRTKDRIKTFVQDANRFAPEQQLPFIAETLGNLRTEINGKTTLLGFVGAPWTLAAYASEGGASRHALEIKRLMHSEPELAHELFGAMADAVATYACHQIESGAQIIQVFESWSHHMSPTDFELFAKPYALRVALAVRAKHPEVPLLYFANGGSSYIHRQKDLVQPYAYSGLSLDWGADLKQARKALGSDILLQGNVDPTILLANDVSSIEFAVKSCIKAAGGPANNHILNLGHGVLQQTPEANVAAFVDAAKRFGRRKD